MAGTALTARKPTFSMQIKSEAWQKVISQTLVNPKKVERYTAGIVSAVAVSPQLQMCEGKTILSGSLLGESLGLAHSPQLGHYYLVPFKVKAKTITNAKGEQQTIPEHYDAQFILGYKGYIQLAIRSGNYKKINVMEVKEGELESFNPFDEEIVLSPIKDFDEREEKPTIGYYAMFEYTNGFRKVIYWSKAKMMRHADQYSAAFSKAAFERIQRGEVPKNEMWKFSSFWYKDFDSMAKKTLIRQLISKWGVMSIEMQQAMTFDNTVTEITDGAFEISETDEPIAQVVQPGVDVEIQDEREAVNIDEL